MSCNICTNDNPCPDCLMEGRTTTKADEQAEFDRKRMELCPRPHLIRGNGEKCASGPCQRCVRLLD